MIEATVSQQSINKCKADLLKKLAKIQEQVAIKVYNFIVSADISYAAGPNVGIPARAPQYSGAFMASWNIQSGSPDFSGAVSPTSVRIASPLFPRAGKVLNINHYNFREPIYITNAVVNDQGEHYAGAVEDRGTPRHMEPWKIAYNATQVARLLKDMPA